MNKGFIAVIDSGIGGISVLNELIKLLPNEKFLYYGDNENAPYGNKKREELLFNAFNCIDQLKKFNIKLLVVACNTLSVNVLKEIEEYSGVKTFGIFPPIKKQDTGQKTLLLATISTAKNFHPKENFHVVGLKTIVKEIEEKIFDIDKIDFAEQISCHSVGYFVNRKGYYDEIILGCTHYNFIKNKIFDHFQPQKIYGGEKITAIQVKKYLENKKSLVKYRRFEVLFIGSNKEKNKKIFNLSG